MTENRSQKTSENDVAKLPEKLADIDFYRLRTNLIDVLTEQQIKLGYLKERVRLYYPLETLCHLLSCRVTTAEMEGLLEVFSQRMKQEWGPLSVSRQGERFCLSLHENATEWVHQRLDQTAFWPRFIGLMSQRSVTMEDVRSLFAACSDSFVSEVTVHGEFDELLYFSDGCPDDYRYCFKQEGHHLTYHRFVREDYERLEQAIRDEDRDG